MRPTWLLLGILLLIGMAACGSTEPPDDEAVANQALLRPLDLPSGFAESKEPLEKTKCDPAGLFRREGATAVAVSRGYRSRQATVLETTGMFATTSATNAALSAIPSKETQKCVSSSARQKLSAPAVARKLPPPPLGASANAIRYTVRWDSDVYVEVVSMRVGRSINSVAFVTESRTVAPAIRSSVLAAALGRSRTALSR